MSQGRSSSEGGVTPWCVNQSGAGSHQPLYIMVCHCCRQWQCEQFNGWFFYYYCFWLDVMMSCDFHKAFFLRKSIQLLWGGAYKINSRYCLTLMTHCNLVWSVFAPWEENQSSRIKLPHSWNMQTAYRKKIFVAKRLLNVMDELIYYTYMYTYINVQIWLKQEIRLNVNSQF